MGTAKSSRADKLTMGFAIAIAVLVVSAFVGTHVKPHIAKFCYRIGWLSMQTEDYDSAIPWFDRAIWLRTDYAQAYASRGVARMKGIHQPSHDQRPPSKPEFDLALKDFAAAMQLKPQNPEPYYDRAYAYWIEGDDDQAVQDFDRATQMNPNYFNAYLARGNLHRAMKQYDLAAEDFTNCIRILPYSTQEFEARSDAYESAGKFELAIEDDDYLIQAAPKSGEGWNNRCWHRAIAGKLPEALGDCKQSLSLDPNEAATLDSIGLVYLKMKKSDLAIENYSAALAQNPKLPTSLYGRGMAKIQRGDDGAADLDAAEAIDSDIASEFERWGVPTLSHQARVGPKP
jgi:tetratricopeptide (TPR) repeat protein